MNIRLLRADEIECRVQTVKEKGFSLLLYKDARVDMSVLDETFGVYGWQRKHEVVNGNLFCTVSIYDKQTGQWVDKQDVGTESYTEKEKGQASDSFKRACFNVGIGRELYTGPFIWISELGDIYDTKRKDKYNNPVYGVSGNFEVSEIGYNDNREINLLVIMDGKGKVRYRYGSKTPSTEKYKGKADIPAPQEEATNTNVLKCSDCDADITPAVKTYSEKKMGKPLCFDCQKKYK